MRLFAPFDHGSRSNGSRQGCFDLHKQLGQPEDLLLEIQYANCAEQLIAANVAECVAAKRAFKMIAGDHTNTYFSVTALLATYPSMNLVIFDAHHDAYADALCHWSFVYHLWRAHDINITIYGLRYEIERSELTQMSFDASLPTYISVDADYFPHMMRVGHQVPARSGLSDETYRTEFRRVMDELNGRPIMGYDFCEWYGGAKDEQSFIVQHVLKKLDSACDQSTLFA